MTGLALILICLLGRSRWQRQGRTQSAPKRQPSPEQTLAPRPPPDSDRRLRQQLGAVSRQTQELRASMYREDVDIVAMLLELEASLAALTPMTEKHPKNASLWIGLGIGWYWVGQDERAEAALKHAEALTPRDGWINLYLGRIYLEKSMLLQLAIGDTPGTRRSLSRKRNHRLAGIYINRSVDGWVGARALDRELVRAYRLLISMKYPQLERLCATAIKRFAGQLGSEEFWIIRGLNRDGAHRLQFLDQAIRIRPHHPMALFWRGFFREQSGDHAGAIAD